MSRFDVPVVMIMFNRPDHVAQVFETVRAVQPSTLLLVADGPRADHPDDTERCRAVRAVVDDVDWECEVLRDFSDANLGCDRRVTSGLDWAFSVVPEAIVLEDDCVPDPSFFPWAAAMLARYRGADDITQVAGRNDLGRWGPPGADHLLARFGSIYGWASWARAWNGVDHDLTAAYDPATPAHLEALGVDPLLREHVMIHLAAVLPKYLKAWDWRWSSAQTLAGGWSVIPPVNLVRNSGFGADSTHTTFAGNLQADLIVGTAPPVDPDAPRPAPDLRYDHLALLAEIMGTYREPEVIRRVARTRKLFDDPDGQLVHHLAPFYWLDDSLEVTRHLRAVGVESDTLDRIERAFLAERARIDA